MKLSVIIVFCIPLSISVVFGNENWKWKANRRGTISRSDTRGPSVFRPQNDYLSNTPLPQYEVGELQEGIEPRPITKPVDFRPPKDTFNGEIQVDPETNKNNNAQSSSDSVQRPQADDPYPGNDERFPIYPDRPGPESGYRPGGGRPRPEFGPEQGFRPGGGRPRPEFGLEQGFRPGGGRPRPEFGPEPGFRPEQGFGPGPGFGTRPDLGGEPGFGPGPGRPDRPIRPGRPGRPGGQYGGGGFGPAGFIGNRPGGVFGPGGGGYGQGFPPRPPLINEGDIDRDPSAILTGPIPSWVRPPFLKKFDRCKCSEKFNCNSPGFSFGHCDVGKVYCCYNSKGNALEGIDIPNIPIHAPENGVLVGPGGPAGLAGGPLLRPDRPPIRPGGFGGIDNGLIGPGRPDGPIGRPPFLDREPRPFPNRPNGNIHTPDKGVLIGPGGPYDVPNNPGRPDGYYSRSVQNDSVQKKN